MRTRTSKPKADEKGTRRRKVQEGRVKVGELFALHVTTRRAMRCDAHVLLQPTINVAPLQRMIPLIPQGMRRAGPAELVRHASSRAPGHPSPPQAYVGVKDGRSARYVMCPQVLAARTRRPCIQLLVACTMQCTVTCAPTLPL